MQGGCKTHSAKRIEPKNCVSDFITLSNWPQKQVAGCMAGFAANFSRFACPKGSKMSFYRGDIANAEDYRGARADREDC
jgi:hypothetical protein